MKQGIETLGYSDFIALLTSESAESMNRPAFALSEFAGALLHILPLVKNGLASGLLGDGMTYIRDVIEELEPDLQNLNSFSGQASDDTEEIRASVTRVLKKLRAAGEVPHFKDFLMHSLRLGQGLTHLAYQMVEWTYVAENPQEWATHVGHLAEQPGRAELKEVKKAGDDKTARKRQANFLTVARQNKKRPRAQAAAPAGGANFRRLGQ